MAVVEGGGYVLEVVADYGAMSRAAADAMAEVVGRVPGANIAVPTGKTPLGMFDELIARVERREVSFSEVHVWCLDEYVGVGEDEPNSLTGWLHGAFLRRAGVDGARVHSLPSLANDPDEAAAAHDAALVAAGGLELAVLGLGGNGHVAYNEPGSGADSRTRVLDLTPESLAGAAAYWEGEVPIPQRAMTVGIGTLLEARRLVLIVSGEGKAEVLRRTLREEMTESVPASWLRLAGGRFTVIADEAAASRLA